MHVDFELELENVTGEPGLGQDGDFDGAGEGTPVLSILPGGLHGSRHVSLTAAPRCACGCDGKCGANCRCRNRK